MKITASEVKEAFGVSLPEYPFFTKEKYAISAFVKENIGVRIYGNNSMSEGAYIEWLKYDYDPKTDTLTPDFELITVDEFNAALLSTFENIKNIVNQ